MGVLAFLLGTLALGVTIRLQLAGAHSLGVFAHLRHAHSHLAYFGVLFPALWGVWALWGGRAPPPAVLIAYGIATVAAIAGFAAGGYGLLAIAGSSVVGVVWLLIAWQNRRFASPRRLIARSWLGSGPLAVVVAAGFVPLIAVMTSRDLAFAQELAHMFLGVLLFGALVPAALSLIGARAPPAIVWLGAALIAAVLTPGLVLLGLLVAGPIARSRRLPGDLRLAWLIFAAGSLVVGAGVVPRTGAIDIAAVHFLVLAPLLGTFAWRRFRALPVPLRWLHLAATSAMSLAITAHHQGAASAAGVAVLVVDAIAAAALLLRGRAS